MKKVYQKPEIAVENFLLNQFIAGSCSIKMNQSESCYNDWEAGGMTGASPDIVWQIQNQNLFLDGYATCSKSPNEPTDGVCYFTQGTALFQS